MFVKPTYELQKNSKPVCFEFRPVHFFLIVEFSLLSVSSRGGQASGPVASSQVREAASGGLNPRTAPFLHEGRAKGGTVKKCVSNHGIHGSILV